ncbi:zinc finger CCCH domain-containing protein 19-like protein, partial [Tanacetum coccineum]
SRVILDLHTLRECVEKLQLLKTPEERARRLQDIPVIHDDSTMDPNHESENDADENDKKQDMYQSSLSSNSSKRQDYYSKESWSSTGAGTSRSSGKNYELSRNLSDNKVEDVITAARFKPHNENLWDQGRDVVVRPPSILKKPSSTNETEKNMVPTEDVSETEEMWHYRDPSGKIQGPFSMAKLRKWNNSKFFPVDLRIWKKSEKEGDSVLLTDALEGRFSMANLPSPTPNRTIADSGLVVPSVVPDLYHGGNEGLQSPTPLGTSQNLAVGPYSGSGDRQPWPSMGSGNQSSNWGTASQGSWSVAAGPGNVSPGWVASRGPSQGSRGSGNGNSKSVGTSGSSPTARNQGYKRSGFSEDKRDRHRSSGFRDDRKNWDKHRSFDRRRRSRDYDRY